MLEEDAGLYGVTRYYDPQGHLVGAKTVVFEHAGAPPVIEGTLPTCELRGLASTCIVAVDAGPR